VRGTIKEVCWGVWGGCCNGLVREAGPGGGLKERGWWEASGCCRFSIPCPNCSSLFHPKACWLLGGEGHTTKECVVGKGGQCCKGLVRGQGGRALPPLSLSERERVVGGKRLLMVLCTSSQVFQSLQTTGLLGPVR